MSTLIAMTGRVALRGLIASALAFIGFFVGVSSVLLPIGVSLGVVAVAGLVLIWALPDLRTVPDKLAHRLFYMLIAAYICVPSYYALIFPGLPWISLRRAILYPFFAAVVLTLAASSTRRAEVIFRLKSSPFLLSVCTGYFIILLLNLLVSVNPAFSVTVMVNDIMESWVPLIATVLLITSRERLDRVFQVFVWSALFDTTVGLIETRLKSPFLIYLLPPPMRAELVARDPFFAGLLQNSGLRNGLYRATSTYHVPLSWGEMAAMVTPIAAYFIVHGKNNIARTIGIFGFLSCFVSCILSGSRGAYIGFIASLVIYFLLWAYRRNKTHPQFIGGGITLALYSMFSIALLLAVVFIPRLHTFVFGGADSQFSNDGRTAEWALAKPKIYARPILGYGPGTAGAVVGYVNAAGNPSLDSYFINLFVDTGVPGFIFFMGILITVMYNGFKLYVSNKTGNSLYANSIGCSVLAYAIYRSSLSQTENDTMMFVLIGCNFVINHLCSDTQHIANIAKPDSSRIIAFQARTQA